VATMRGYPQISGFFFSKPCFVRALLQKSPDIVGSLLLDCLMESVSKRVAALQCVAVFQCVACLYCVYCRCPTLHGYPMENVLQCAIVCCSVLQRIAACCSA